MARPDQSPMPSPGEAAHSRGCATVSALRGSDTIQARGDRLSLLGRRLGSRTEFRGVPFLQAVGRLSIGMALAFSCLPVAAESRAAQASPSQPTASAAAPHADTATERFDRGQWNLGDAEWQRYQGLMQGIRGSISPPTLSPIEALGIHARDEKERMDYARRFAKIMRDDAQRVVAFQAAFDRAMAELNPATTPASQAGGPDPIQPGDRLLLFVRLADCPACEARLDEALTLNKKAGRLDIYAVGGATDDAIRAWATAHRIDPEAVRAARTTLNRDNGELSHIAGMAGTAPLLVRLRNNAATVIPPGTTP